MTWREWGLTAAHRTTARTLAGVATEYVRDVLPIARAETEHWKVRAAAIPDPQLRRAALDALVQKRWAVDGAALFATTAPQAGAQLVRLLVAYQILCDYLDSITEWETAHQVESGMRLHRSLVEAVDVDAPITDHYARHPRHEDGGYVRALVESCQRDCCALPSYDIARGELALAARRVEVQALNHDTHVDRRTAALRRWVDTEFPACTDARWFEISGAAASSLHIHAMLASASLPCASGAEIRTTREAYFPWVCASATMLDSLVDRERDAAAGEHSYVTYYSGDRDMLTRLAYLTRRASTGVSRLPYAGRHAIVVAGMAAMYLSEPHTAMTRRTRRTLLRAAGSPAEGLFRCMRVWRLWRRARA